jgi:hypothetical protein
LLLPFGSPASRQMRWARSLILSSVSMFVSFGAESLISPA